MKNVLAPRSRMRTPWLRWVLLCMAFSALHGLLGAWVVSAIAGGQVVEICTPNGMQWVAVDAAPTDLGSNPVVPDRPQGLSQPCVWAMAHVATPPLPCAGQCVPEWDQAPMARLPHPGKGAAHLPTTVERVLLMAPMRAPPA